MESVMILGGGPLQVPAIKKAKEIGMHVIVCDYDPNAVGFSYADETYLISTIDQDAVLAKAEELHPDFVLTSTSDAPVRTAAYVCEKLGIPYGLSYKDAICATVKSAMRQRLSEHHVPIPQFYICENYEEFEKAIQCFSDVCIIKPSDSSASRGVILINVNDDLEKIKKQYDYCLSNAHNGVVVVEEFMKGPEVSVECFVVEGKVDIIAITDKMITELPFFVELGHSEQSQLPTAVKQKIREVTKMAIKAIGIQNGVSHTELKITDEGPKVVEIAARLGGDFITARLVPLATGVDMVGNSLLLEMNKNIDLERKKECGSAIRFIIGKKGILREIKMLKDPQEIPGIQEVEFYLKPGDMINDVRSSNDRVGHVIACGDTAELAIESAEKALGCIELIID